MKKITPHLWFDNNAKEATEFYVSAFPNSKITSMTALSGVPSPTGDTNIFNLEIMGQPFIAIDAGPIFKPNPSISFFVNFDPSKDSNAKENLNTLWEKMLPGGKVLMPLQEYPFSKWYGWIEDKFGVSWQLILSNPEGAERQDIIPSLLFVGDNYGKAEEAFNFYMSVFKDSEKGQFVKYPEENAVMFSDMKLLNTWIVAMDGKGDHKFQFSEGISLLIPCDSQEEIDYYWEKLSAVKESEECGWLKDKFGVSWQVHPTEIDKMFNEGTEEQVQRVTQAFLKMKKFDIQKLRDVFEGK